ncbi:MAG TPA: bacillithiol biosynthesis cysteine-adding enzyme BshC [Candidatus Acidoferrum sp.]|jgi:bacillithiol biosynthesis cysteine-adding enzyme BshC
MNCRALSPDRLPHTSKLYGDFVKNFSKVKGFYEHPPELKSVVSVAKKLSYPAERRREVTDILRQQNVIFGSGEETAKNLVRLENGAVAVVSGQQVGLFGGPAYSFYKALSAIRAAAELTDAGIEAVPVFWMATEDHDVDEVRHTTWFHDGQLRRFELPKASNDAQPVGRIRLGDEVTQLVGEAEPDLGQTFGEILRESYTAVATYSSAFANLFARIFQDFGLILLDPLDERLHRVAAPLLQRALAERDEVNELLLKRGKELEHAGYEVQVNVTSRSTLLFSLCGGQRQVISAANGQFVSGQKSAARDAWLHEIEAEPQCFSPNAIFRPVVQDYLLPTVAYFGGPAEIAYYAQSQVLYEKLLGRMPVILPRADFTLVDPKAVRILKKYGLQVEDVWAGKQELLKRMHATNVPKKLARDFDSSLHQLEKSLKQLHKGIAEVDPTIQGTIARAEKRIRYQIEKLRQKTGAALDRREKLVQQHADFLENLLYPQKGLQSRDLCFLPFLARWGSGGLHELEKLASPKKPGRHCIVPIP